MKLDADYFQDFDRNCATALSTLAINVNFLVIATCIFYLSSPIYCTSPWA